VRKIYMWLDRNRRVHWMIARVTMTRPQMACGREVEDRERGRGREGERESGREGERERGREREGG